MEITSIDCPKCGGNIQGEICQGKIFKCTHCGSTLVWPDRLSKLALSFGIRLCPECGVDNEHMRDYCRNCGTPLIKVCPQCKSIFYVGDNFCPNGHDYELNIKKGDISPYLNSAEGLARKGNLDQAEKVLEEAIIINPEWAPQIAGYPCQTHYPQSKIISGYALLGHLAGVNGNKENAIHYITRMLELFSEYPGDENPREAARDAKVDDEVKIIFQEMGIKWNRWV